MITGPPWRYRGTRSLSARGWPIVAAALGWLGGCGGDARVELAAADSLEAIALELENAIAEYDRDLTAGDDARERAAALALAEWLRPDGLDDADAENHTDAFLQAMDRLRADRAAARARYGASRDNVQAMREIASGLRRLAIDSLSLNDEARRYFQDLITTWWTARQRGPETTNP